MKLAIVAYTTTFYSLYPFGSRTLRFFGGLTVEDTAELLPRRESSVTATARQAAYLVIDVLNAVENVIKMDCEGTLHSQGRTVSTRSGDWKSLGEQRKTRFICDSGI